MAVPISQSAQPSVNENRCPSLTTEFCDSTLHPDHRHRLPSTTPPAESEEKKNYFSLSKNRSNCYLLATSIRVHQTSPFITFALTVHFIINNVYVHVESDKNIGVITLRSKP